MTIYHWLALYFAIGLLWSGILCLMVYINPDGDTAHDLKILTAGSNIAYVWIALVMLLTTLFWVFILADALHGRIARW